MNLCFCCENVDDLKKLDPFKWWNNVLQKVRDSVRVCQTLSLRERLGQNGDTEKQLFEKLGEWVRKPFQKPLPSQGEPWVELPNTQMVFYFLFQRTPISSKIWQRNVHLASRKSGAKKKSGSKILSHQMKRSEQTRSCRRPGGGRRSTISGKRCPFSCLQPQRRGLGGVYNSARGSQRM